MAAIGANDQTVEQRFRHAYVLGRLAATVHFYFPCSVASNPFDPCSKFSTVADVRRAQALHQRLRDADQGWPWFDFIVRRAEDIGSGVPSPKKRGVFVSTPSWLLEELKPRRLSALRESLHTMPPSEWRDEVIDLVVAWVESSLYVAEHARLADSILPLSDRLSFEFHSYLCGVGETSSSWNFAAMSECPFSWFRDAPRLLSVAFHAGQERTRLLLRIPLFAAAEDRCRLANDARAIVEVFADVARVATNDSGHTCGLAALHLACSLLLEIELVGRSSYRVCTESLDWDIAANRHSTDGGSGDAFNRVALRYSTPWWVDWIRRCVALPHSNNSAGTLRTRRVAAPPTGALRNPMASGQGSPRTLSPSRSPTTLPLPPPSSSPPNAPLAVECPSFVSSHRQSNATLMEFVPLLEAHIRDEILREPLHFCLLVKALSAEWGPPAAVSATVEPVKHESASGGDGNDDGDVNDDADYQRRYCVFVLQDLATHESVSVIIIYEGIRTLPSAMVCSTQHEMPYQSKALCAKARLVLPLRGESTTEGKPYNVAEVADALRHAVMQRFVQMIAIVQLHAREESDARSAQHVVQPVPLANDAVHVDPAVDCVPTSEALGTAVTTAASVESCEGVRHSQVQQLCDAPSSTASPLDDTAPSSDDDRVTGDPKPCAPVLETELSEAMDREPSASAPPEE